MFYMEIIFFFIFWFSGTSESFLFFDWSEPFYYVNNLTLHHWAYWWLSLWLELHRLLIGISCLFLYNIHVEKLWQQRIKALCYNKYKRRFAFSLFLLILDNINQKRKLHANNTRNHRVSQVSLHICARARKKQIVYLS